jgi:dipeptidyl-peptidase-4
MTAYALTHSTSWAGGIVGAPVTDWRDYDTVYTERLMKMPQNNPEGTARRRRATRRRACTVDAADARRDGRQRPHAELDSFAYELQHAGKPFEMMIYAKSRHGFEDPLLIKHRAQTMYDFVLKTVGGRRSRVGRVSVDLSDVR